MALPDSQFKKILLNLKELARDMLGLKLPSGGIDGAAPETKEQFDDLEKLIGKGSYFAHYLFS